MRLTPVSPRIRLLVLGLSLAIGSSGASAATVTIAGSITGLTGPNNDQIDQWRTNTVAKTMDPDGDNVYGTAGYVFYATDAAVNSNTGAVVTTDPLTYVNGTRATLSQIPSFLTLANNGQNQIASSYGYKLMDDPSQPVGSAVADVESGAALKGGVALGTEASLLNLSINSAVPSGGLRVGLFFGNTDNFSGTIRLTQTVGGSASATFNQTIPTAGTELGMVFFDITSAAVGDTFTLSIMKDNPQPAGGNLNANVIYGGLTFDTVAVPEPATTWLLLAGAAFISRRPRR